VKSKQPKKEKAGTRGGRPQPTRSEAQGDTYRSKRKGVETKLAATVCTECGAVYSGGRWHWGPVANPAREQSTLCPACERIRDRYPAGEVHVSGEFARAHRDEIVARIRHVEAREKSEHPLQRLMDVREDGDSLLVTTTDVHLANAIGRALHDAFKGDLDAPWQEKGDLLRVSWTR
jgi:NMD protein affecting ribosome stability and mRNA decay